jgi:hypothetical protein
MELRAELLAMAAHDLQVRDRLASDGSLFDGYHPEMRAVHERNADRLAEMLDAHGWPNEQRVGADGAEAAWLIIQHAISRPSLARRALDELRKETARGTVPAWQPAYLEDRIRVFEGRAQLHGTHFDWDEAGLMSPSPIEDEDGVDARRAAIGLRPLSEQIARMREETRHQPRPEDRESRRAEIGSFARSVGWR